MNEVLLSVITPVFQGERFIESCLKSVIDQRCEQLEHLIIDGGSKDKTMDIVRDYAKRYPHIRFVSEKDNGQSNAMNKGILMARGRFIGILNVDDYYEPGAILEALPILKKLREPAFLSGNCRNWNTDGTLSGINVPNKLDVASFIVGAQFPNNPASYFYHRSLHDKAGLYDENDHYSMDLDFLLKAIPKANVKYVNRIWGNYRLIEGTKTFESIQAGRIWDVIKKHYDHHYQFLPWHKKMYVDFIFAWRYFIRRAKYYLVRVKQLIKL